MRSMNFMSGLFRANISSSTRWPKTKNISSVSNAGFSSQLAESRKKFTGHSVTRRLPSSFSRCLSNTSSTASASTADSGASMHDKVYELRIYDFKPYFLGDFTKLSNENFHLRTKHSKLLGYWFTEFGGANQVCLLWYFACWPLRYETMQCINVLSKRVDAWDAPTLPPLKHFNNCDGLNRNSPIFVRFRWNLAWKWLMSNEVIQVIQL